MILLAETNPFDAPTPYPINIVHGLPPDYLTWISLAISLILAVVTGLLFNATRAMASETKRLADKTAEMAMQTAALAGDTVDASIQADNHHQQTLWPLVTIASAHIVRVDIGQCSLAFSTKNVGGGPSPFSSLRVMKINTIAPEIAIAVPIPPLGSGDTFGSTVDLGRHSQSLEITFEITYTTIFDSAGTTGWTLGETMPLSPMLNNKLPDVVRRPQ